MRPSDHALGIAFNVNEYIMAKLKPAAWAEFDRYYRSLGLDPPEYRKSHPENAEGWSAWQLWEFMRLFGHITRMGPPPPYATEIRLFPEVTP